MRRRLRPFLCALVCCLAATSCFAGATGQPELEHGLDRRIRAVRDRLEAHRDALSWNAATRDAHLAMGLLKIEKIDILRRNPWTTRETLAGRIGAELSAAEEHAAALGTPLTGHTTPGRHELAYLSPIDLCPEPCLVYVPSGYEPGTDTPLLVFLHGYDSFIDKVNWSHTMYSPAMEELAEGLGFLVALPYGRSNTEFMGVGETEVLNTLAFIRRHYGVADGRIVLSGASMGGSGAYSIATHYPHRFAGLMAITGRMDYYLWMGVKRESLPRFKQIMADTDYVQNALDNLRHVPLMLFQGGRDERPFPQVEQSRRLHRRLTALRYDSTYHEFGGGGHYIWGDSFSHPDLAGWLHKRRAPASPRKVTFGTMTLRYHRAYWVDILEFERWGERAWVEATVTGDSQISVKTRNVARLALRPGKLVDAEKPLTVDVNGEGVTIPPGRAEALYLDPADEHAEGPQKTPALCGPVREAYRSRFVIVEGTMGTAEEVAAEHRRATEAAREWEGFTQGRARLVADADVTDEHIRECNLVLIGSPQTNRITARIADRLPIGIEKDHYVVADRRVPRDGAGLLMIYPNPLNPQRYLVVSDGPRWGKDLQINHKLDLVPDFIIYTQETISTEGYAPYVRGVCAANKHICAGFFDKHWRLSDRLTWWAEKGRED